MILLIHNTVNTTRYNPFSSATSFTFKQVKLLIMCLYLYLLVHITNNNDCCLCLWLVVTETSLECPLITQCSAGCCQSVPQIPQIGRTDIWLFITEGHCKI